MLMGRMGFLTSGEPLLLVEWTLDW